MYLGVCDAAPVCELWFDSVVTDDASVIGSAHDQEVVENRTCHVPFVWQSSSEASWLPRVAVVVLAVPAVAADRPLWNFVPLARVVNRLPPALLRWPHPVPPPVSLLAGPRQRPAARKVVPACRRRSSSVNLAHSVNVKSKHLSIKNWPLSPS